ncbi:hypothetical protein GCM10022381_12940 [Leifsonia kafniensis]|uniref:Asp23/Gls24 family envelope stress response protein n=1 Tax=Leifsonia kafniensis TaxID=475957 RepID=A0ABP7KAT2_9MICO
MDVRSELFVTVPHEVSIELVEKRLARPAFRPDRVDVDLLPAIIIGAVSAATTVVVTEVTKATIKGIVAAIRRWAGKAAQGSEVTITVATQTTARATVLVSADSDRSFDELEETLFDAFTRAEPQVKITVTDEQTAQG